MSLQDPDYSCYTNITGNTDVGGPGILGSFTFTAWLTIALSGFLAWDEVIKLKKESRQDSQELPADALQDHPPGHRLIGPRTNTFLRSYVAPPRDANGQPSNPSLPILNGELTDRPGSRPSPRHHHRVVPDRDGFEYILSIRRLPSPPVLALTTRVSALLGTLCDLQAITGLGIVVAGMSQWSGISFYHEQLALLYYSMTLNSFWAARVNYMSWDDQVRGAARARLVMRRLVIIAASALNLAWQIYIYWREKWSGQWPHNDEHNVPDGHCYRYKDRSNPTFVLVFWGLGQLIFTVTMCLGMSHYTCWINGHFLTGTEIAALWLWGWLQHFRNLCRRPQEPSLTFAQLLGRRGRGLLDVWSYGEGFYPFSWLVYVAFMTYNTWGVASLVALNRSMVEDRELVTWGFGQVLPVIMLFSIVYAALDVYVAGMEEEGQEQTSFKYLPTGTVKELIDQPLFGFHY
ncbi:hypothetical protein NQ176_g1971 [Zarea fungicola]|uniref:Uncharacterized protein n=1 Tax=Zarea fungicola TaxID=93591 RepID=A0ACC1NQG6_9HYPO|nr:hypothetical protein NQ176_g1971 [Lecanicillium fungicola]